MATSTATRSTEPEFAVESYLRYQGKQFVDRFDANTYLLLSRALTYFDLGRSYGGGSLAAAVARAQGAVPAALVQLRLDVPDRGQPRAARRAARRAASRPQHAEIDSSYGHDSFLLEDDTQREHIAPFLADTHARA